MRRRFGPIIIALCTVILGASVSYAQKGVNALGFTDKSSFNALGVTEVPELQGFGGVALLTVVASVGYGARKIYQKITRRGRE
ncbi:MAG TPA: hypothetical protein VMH05_01565 [Bryobacteraceae bacterium]|nr:hypothetical protein [Bryobacteraceae bacterium]